MYDRESNELYVENRGLFMVSDIIFNLDPALTPYEFRVYTFLCYRRDRCGQAFPSYKSLMAKCGIGNIRTAKKAIDGLINRGLITAEKRHAQDGGSLTNAYTIYNKPRQTAD